jgi:hypothetical protein
MPNYTILSDYEKQKKLKEVEQECLRLRKAKYWVLKQMNIPKSTYYDWLKVEGRSKSKAPHTIWNKTDPNTEAKILSIRNNKDLYRSQRAPNGISALLEQDNIFMTSVGVWRVLKRNGESRRLIVSKKQFIIYPKGEKFLDVVCIDDIMLTNQKPRDTAIFNAIDEYSQSSVAIRFIPHRVNKFDVISLIGEIKRNYGIFPKKIRLDNAKAHISWLVKKYCKARSIELQFIDPGTPQQNWPVESFNGVIKEDLIERCFWGEENKQEALEDYRNYYNNEKRLNADPLKRTPNEIATAVASKTTQHRLKIKLIRKHYGQVAARQAKLNLQAILLQENLSEMCVN